MNLNELQESSKTRLAVRVLRENYEIDLNLSKLSIDATQKMLRKVRGLINETRSTAAAHSSHSNPEYLKLLMMDQALSGHLNDLRTHTQIVVENEEVQKSQVILAAQDMIDSVQKMLEQVSKMNVEELPAVVSGIENEIGVNESEQFSQSVGTALKTLQDAITAAKAELDGALGVITGESAPAAMPAELPSLGGEAEAPAPAELPELPEEPEEEEEVTGNLGRGRR